MISFLPSACQAQAAKPHPVLISVTQLLAYAGLQVRVDVGDQVLFTHQDAATQLHHGHDAAGQELVASRGLLQFFVTNAPYGPGGFVTNAPYAAIPFVTNAPYRLHGLMGPFVTKPLSWSLCDECSIYMDHSSQAERAERT